MEEIWKQINGFEQYEVSNVGRVRRGNFIRKICYGTPYGTVGFRKGKTKVNKCVHILVLETFVGPRPGHCRKIHGCHNDGDKTNNALANLRWDTAESNVADKKTHDVVPRAEKHHKARLNQEKVLDILRNYNGRNCRFFAEKYGVRVATVLAVYNGISWRRTWLEEKARGNTNIIRPSKNKKWIVKKGA